MKAIYNCVADNPDELTFSEGDIIVVDGEEDQEWWVSIFYFLSTYFKRNTWNEEVDSDFIRFLLGFQIIEVSSHGRPIPGVSSVQKLSFR